MPELLSIFLHVLIIGITSYAGSAQAVFYDVGVTQLHWISTADYTNFLGFGFASPGPQVYSLATFMGFGAASWSGALVATLAIYILPITLAIIAGKYLKKWLNHNHMQYFITAVGLAAAGILVYVAGKILNANTISPLYLAIAVAAAVATTKKLNPFFIIIGGLLAGLFLR